MELESEFKGLLSNISDWKSVLNVSAEVDSNEDEKCIVDDEESEHIETGKSVVDFVEVGKLGYNLAKNMAIDSFSVGNYKCKDVQENLQSNSTSAQVCNEEEDEVKSVVVGMDGSKKDDNGDENDVIVLDSDAVEGFISGRKRKRESMCRVVNWITGIAKNPCEPVVGSLPERSKWESYGNEVMWKQVLLVREALFLKRHVDSSAEKSTCQKNRKMHPCMYDDQVGSAYNFRQSDSKWAGTRVWPPEKVDNRFVIEREPIGKGRQDSCGCEVPKSVECVRFHNAERRLRVKRELGAGFHHWRFDKMGEDVKLSWTEEEERKFKAIVRLNPHLLISVSGMRYSNAFLPREGKIWMMSDYKVEMINDGMQDFYVHFHGPNDSPYHGGVWRIRVELPDAYPYKSPSIGFVNKIYHPNVDEMSGSVCLDVINQTWSPMFDLVNVFEVFLPQLLLYPNPSDPLNGEAAALMMRDRSAYEQKVKEYCEKYAKPEDIGAAPEDKSSDEELSEDEYESQDEEMAGQADP
ncbi:hypothetical protein GH714_020291 [Hevea brasiliensis]|uniref:E2 ubiquitin-conjugating enzyme n=1 Tax=Hevea brasiliensis TaxID=3981 RepID=A0A6A6KQ99_HEVBR|nr:hypothetical protein GH714_020291 [Hevea brasiliensis]